MGDRQRFWGLADEKLYYDERKKRFVSTENIPAHVERAIRNQHFKEVRQRETNLEPRSQYLLLFSCLATSWLVRTRGYWVPDEAEVRTAADPPDELPEQVGDA